MDQRIIAIKLESLRRCIKRVEDKRPAYLNLLVENEDLQDILVLNLTRAVQLCVDIGSHIISESDVPAPKTMGEVFASLEKLGAITPQTCDVLKKAVGFRNVAVHNYDTMNWEIVFAICEKSLADFSKFGREIDSFSKSSRR